MEARFLQEGGSVDYTPAEDMPAGTVAVFNELVGIAHRDMKTGQLGALSFQGIYEIVKETGMDTVMSLGGKVYWDKTNRVATKNIVPETTVYMGKAVKAAGDNDATVRVRLEQ